MIEELTPEQEAQIPVYRQKGFDWATDTTPATDEEIIEALEKVYKHILERDMTEVVIVDSPREALYKLREITGQPDLSYIHPYLDGHLQSYFFAYYDYMFEELGVENPCSENYEALRGVLKMGNIYPLENICVVSRKPTVCKFNEQYHCEDGPALAYGDGYELYFLNGVAVPDWLVKTPAHKLDPKKFAEIKNVEIRREFVRKIGIERLAEKLGAEKLDEMVIKRSDLDDPNCATWKRKFFENPDNADIDEKVIYELLLVDLGEEVGKWPYLKMVNLSIGVYHLECVDQSIRTVKDALKFRNGTSMEPDQLT